MFENMKLKRIEIDDYRRITSIEFGDDCLVKDIVEFCNYYGITYFQHREPTPLEPPTRLSDEMRDKLLGISK